MGQSAGLFMGATPQKHQWSLALAADSRGETPTAATQGPAAAMATRRTERPVRDERVMEEMVSAREPSESTAKSAGEPREPWQRWHDGGGVTAVSYTPVAIHPGAVAQRHAYTATRDTGRETQARGRSQNVWSPDRARPVHPARDVARAASHMGRVVFGPQVRVPSTPVSTPRGGTGPAGYRRGLSLGGGC